MWYAEGFVRRQRLESKRDGIGEPKGGNAVFRVTKGLMVNGDPDWVAKTPIVFRDVRLEKGALEVEGRTGLKGWRRCLWWES